MVSSNRVHLEKQVLYTNGITLSALIKICKEGEGGRETKLQETKKGMKMLNIIYETVENKSVCHFLMVFVPPVRLRKGG